MPASSSRSPLLSLHSVSVVTVLSMGQFVLLIGLQLLVAATYGASAQVDAYLAAYAIPLAIGGILSGTIDSALVPHYHKLAADEGSSNAESEAGWIGFVLVLLSLLIAALLWLAAQQVINVLYGQLSASANALAVEVLRITCWLVPLTTLLGFMFGIYHARGLFLVPSATGLIGPVVTIGIVALATDPSITVLAIAVVAGAAAAIIPMIRGLPLPSFPSSTSQSVRRFAALALPIAIGATYTRLNVLVDRPLAAELSEGSISHLGYSWRIVEAVAAMASSGLAVVVFPLLAKAAAEKKEETFNSTMQEAWQLFTVTIVPVVIGIAFCGNAILSVTFQRGAFTADDTMAVNALLQLYTGVIFAAGIGTVSTRAFVAGGRPWTPIMVGITTFVIASVAKFLVVTRFGVNGLASVTSIHHLVNSAILVGLGAAIWKSSQFRGLGSSFLRSLVAAGVAIAPAWALMQSASIIMVFLAIGLAVIAYPIILYLLHDPHARRAIDKLTRDR